MSSEDRVVAEFDVQLCTDALGQQTQLHLFQYPLRPPWRPYDLDAKVEMRAKPKAQRIELSIPLDSRSENYHYGVDDALRLSHLTLRSKPNDLSSSMALGLFRSRVMAPVSRPGPLSFNGRPIQEHYHVFCHPVRPEVSISRIFCQLRDGKLLLMPVDAAHSLRPALDHLDIPVTQPAGAAETKDSKPASDVETAVQVQYKKQETERQAQQRLRSFAYLSEAEAKEPWVPIGLAEPGVGEKFINLLPTAPAAPIRVPLSRSDYLATLLPSSSERDQDATVLAAALRASGEASTSAPTPSTTSVKRDQAESEPPADPKPAEAFGRYSGPPLSEAEAKAFKKSVMQLLRANPVVKLRGIRWWLANSRLTTPMDRVITGSDSLLHHAAMETGLVLYLREVYVQIKTDSSTNDAFRAVILDMLAKRPAVRRQEIIAAAKERGVALSDSQYLKAIKEICQSRSAVWTLKGGFAGRT